MNKFSLFKFTVFARIFTLILGWPIAENSPGFILHGIFSLLASIAFGYFLYLFLTNSKELIFTHNPDFGSIVRANGGTLTSSFKAHNSGSLYKEIMAGINYRINKKNTVIMNSSGAERIQIQNPKTLTFLSGIRISF